MAKAKYVDGFVLVVPKNKVNEYKKMAIMGRKIWKKLGAIDYKECIIDDAKPEHVTFTFPKMVKAKKNEVIFFSYITYKSRAQRDSINKKMMKEMEKEMKGGKEMPMPMDMKRFAFGGFKVFVD